MNIRTTLGIAALAVTLPFTASAAMIKGAQGQSVSVDTAPYNLSSAAGQEMLYSKLQRAAEQVCGETDLRKAGSLEQALQARACIRDAVDGAVEDVNHAGLSSLHERS